MKRNFRRFSVSFLFLCLFCSAKAQVNLNQKVSVSYQNLALAEVLVLLKRDYQIKFSYSNEQIALQDSVTLLAKNQTLQSILDKIAAQAGFKWELVSGHV
ncbi:DUF4974 domain-containing protein, partial [Pseudoxanthomonas sp. SGD-10]